MAIFHKPIKSFLTVVAFLILTAIAIVVYGGNEENQAQLAGNNLYQKTRQVFISVGSAVQWLTDWNLSHDLGSGNDLADRIKEEANSQRIENDAAAWSDLWSSIKNNWSNRNNDAINNDEATNQGNSTVFDLSSVDNALEADSIEKVMNFFNKK